jgi:antirestriction protein
MATEPAPLAPLGTTSAPTPGDRPRIYVACLAAYNNGCLHGRWIDATTPDAIMANVRAMLADSPIPGAEEWAIHDHEGFEGASLPEHASFETVCALAAFIAEHGRLGAKAYGYYGNDLGEACAAFEDYAGQYCSAAGFAEALVRECGTEIPAALEYYIDWEALARDMELNGEILIFPLGFDEVHVFWTR